MILVLPCLLFFVPGLRALALWPLLLCTARPDPVLENHERIHFDQQLELLIVGFYVLYVADYLFQRAQGLGHWDAYREICFEREAFENEADLTYRESRPRFAFLSYF